METVRQILRRHNIQPRKGLGQNFLVNVGVMEKIVRAVGPCTDEPLLEIGPGVGVLTRLLADAGARVTAVEADRRMVEVLEAELGTHTRVRILLGDILEVDLENLVRGSKFEVRSLTQDAQRRTQDERWRVVGNIPYNISSPILFLLRDHRHLVSEATLMLQREVADRLTATVGTKDYGLLTVGLGVVGTCERLFDVAPGSFWPPPKVVSTVVRIQFPDPPPYPALDLEAYSRIVRAAFGKRRKTIRNALTMAAGERLLQGLTSPPPPAKPAEPPPHRRRAAVKNAIAQLLIPRQIDTALAAAGIDPARRPETVTVEEYVRLTDLFRTGKNVA